MSDSKNKPVNFSQPINYLKVNFTKIGVSMLYYPIIVSYVAYSEALEEANQLVELNGGDSEEAINKYCEAIDLFNYKEIKTFINDSIIELSSLLLKDDEDDFFNKNYLDLKYITKKFDINESQVQKLRSQLYNFFRIVNNELGEMERSYKRIENIFEKAGDTATGLRNGITGGAVGATVGSFLLPGIGTVLGGLAGGYFLNKNSENKSTEKFYEELTNYATHCDRVINHLGSNGRELYKTLESFINGHYRNNIRQMYFELKEAGHSADQIMTEFFKHDMNLVNETLNSNIDEDDNSSMKTNEIIEEVHGFLKEY
jgi:hypothetical protein